MSRRKTGLTILDLFAGAGGMTRGFVAEGFAPVGAVEMDPAAAASYGANFGSKHLFVGRVEDFLASARIPRADIVVGGPPCQGFSNLGQRSPADPRNGLWRCYAEVVRRVQPAFFVVENVDGFLISDEFSTLAWHFRRGGFFDGYRLSFAQRLNSANFGVPQRRVRSIIIGVRGGLPDPIIQPTHDRQDWVGVRSALSGITSSPSYLELPDVGIVEVRTSDGQVVRVAGTFKTSDLHVGRRPTQTSLKRYAAIPPGGNWTDLSDELRAPCWRRRRSAGTTDVMGRLRWNEPSVTIRTEFFKPEKGRYLHPAANRPITHREAAALQGFSEDHLWCGSKVQIARQIGNAVPPPLAAGVARAVRKALM
jgi:DNA (cytosine-5)-methyltransferase 1